MKNLFHRIRLYLSNIGEVGNMSLTDVGFAITATVLVGAIVVTSGAGVINDTEEKAHYLNANGLIAAAEMFAKDTRLKAGGTETFTLRDLQVLGLIDEAIDPTTEDSYGSDNTQVTVAAGLDSNFSNPVYTFDVKLVSDAGWTYLDTANDLGIRIPARHEQDASSQL